MLLPFIIAFGSIWLIMLHKLGTFWHESIVVAPPVLSWCQAVRLESDGSERKFRWTGLTQTKDAHQGSPIKFRNIFLNFWALLSPPPLHGSTLLCMGGLVSPHRLLRPRPPCYLKDFSFKHRKHSRSCYFLSVAEANVWHSRLLQQLPIIRASVSLVWLLKIITMLIKEGGAVAHVAYVKSTSSSCVREGFPGTPGLNYSCVPV